MADVICVKCNKSFCPCTGSASLCPSCRVSNPTVQSPINSLTPVKDFCLSSEIYHEWDRNTGVVRLYSQSGCRFSYGFEGKIYQSGTSINITPSGKPNYIIVQGRDSHKTIILK